MKYHKYTMKRIPIDSSWCVLNVGNEAMINMNENPSNPSSNPSIPCVKRTSKLMMVKNLHFRNRITTGMRPDISWRCGPLRRGVSAHTPRDNRSAPRWFTRGCSRGMRKKNWAKGRGVMKNIQQLIYDHYYICFIMFHICINHSKSYPGWWFEPLWKILVNWDDYSQYMGK